MDYLRKNFKPLAFIVFAAILLGTLCYFMPGGDMSYDECVEANYL